MLYFNRIVGHLLSVSLIGCFGHVLLKLLVAVIRQKNFSFFLTWVKILSFYFLDRQLKEFPSGEFLLVAVQTISEKSLPVFCVHRTWTFRSPTNIGNWPDFIFVLPAALGFIFFYYLYFLFLFFSIEVKFWYRTGCTPEGIFSNNRTGTEHFNRSEALWSQASLCERNWMKKQT